jgi:collagenase-like PrtC family protease
MDRFLCLATSWDDDLILQLEKQGIYNKISELFGSLNSSIVGSGRASFALPEVSMEQARLHIRKAHSLGIKFNYLLNASCMGNREFTDDGREKILALLDWLNECEVDMVTISLPYFVDIVKRYFPKIGVSISVTNRIDSVASVKIWEAMGVDRIVLDPMKNRDFELLRAIRNATDCQLEVLMNSICVYGCPFLNYHYNIFAHGSQEDDGKDAIQHRLATSYLVLKCEQIKLSDFSEIIKSPFIRPEDIKVYRELGIQFFKVKGRATRTSAILETAKAYSEESYEGNLLDIVPLIPSSRGDDARIIADPPIYVDNKKLDGFLDYFQSSKCRTHCNKCSYCRGIAKKTVRVIDQKRLDEFINPLAKEYDCATNWDEIVARKSLTVSS